MTFLLLALLCGSARADTYPAATYDVPVPAELRAYATFPVAYSVAQDANGRTTLTYTLPATLLGKDRSFTLTGQAGTNAPAFALHGADADMDCDASQADVVNCQVQYHGVAIDLAGVQAALDASNASPQDKAGRLQVATLAARGGGDLVGVIHYPKLK